MFRGADRSTCCTSPAPPPDCVVSAYRLADADGIELLRAVRAEHPGLPFVLYTAAGSERIASEAIAAGVTDYVRREDGGRDELAERVRAAAATDRADRAGGDGEHGTGGGMAAALRLKERAMDAAPVGITISDPALPDNPMVYVNDAFEELTGYPRSASIGRNCRFLQGEGSDPATVAAMREAINAGEPVSVELRNYRRDGELFWNAVDIAPIRDDEGTLTHFVGFQTDITNRKRAEAAAERAAAAAEAERATLERLLERINGVVREVTEAVVQATVRGELEDAVCERLTASEPYAFAWIGEREVAAERVTERTRGGSATGAGEDEPADDRITVALDGDRTIGGDGTTAIARALDSRELRVARSGTADAGDADGPGGAGPADADRAAWQGWPATAAVPLVCRDSCYGVLCVHAARSDAFDVHERAVLEAMGRTVAAGIDAAESRRVLVADDVVELELALGDPEAFFVSIAERAGCRLEYGGSLAREDGSSLVFFTAEGAPAAAVLAAAEECADLDGAAIVADHGDVRLIECDVAGSSVVTMLAEWGATTESIVADPDGARLRVELAREADARALVAALDEHYAGVELVGYHERERPARTEREAAAALADRLTDRQRTALQRAHLAGFFERPRRMTGDELAASMGVSRSTFHQHLRAAERKLVATFFETAADA
ncbi:hypothetical protein BRC90_00225 [Halobacteriales archaeon QS_4_69_34]|nr:MAG: hypothetical protein BRC90_00225 [Halobacteriales archaeon QS_4_69_34]